MPGERPHHGEKLLHATRATRSLLRMVHGRSEVAAAAKHNCTLHCPTERERPHHGEKLLHATRATRSLLRMVHGRSEVAAAGEHNWPLHFPTERPASIAEAREGMRRLRRDAVVDGIQGRLLRCRGSQLARAHA